MGRIQLERSNTSELFETVVANQQSGFLREQSEGLDAWKSASDNQELQGQAQDDSEGQEGTSERQTTRQSESTSLARPAKKPTRSLPRVNRRTRFGWLRNMGSSRSNQNASGKSLGSGFLEEIIAKSPPSETVDVTNASDEIPPPLVPPVRLRRGVAGTEDLRPGAYRGAPGNDLRRTEKISFALVGATTTSTCSGAVFQRARLADDVESAMLPPGVSALDFDPLQARYPEDEPAVARPVTGKSHRNLPVAEEEIPENSRREQSTSTNAKIATSLLWVGLFLTTSVIVLLCVLLLLPDSKTSNTKPSPTTDAPNITETPTITTMIDLLLPRDTLSAITKPNSPQARAYQWVLDDPYMTTYNAERLVQRFSLATLYFATHGDHWFNNTHWLSYEHSECEWYATNVPNQSDPAFPSDILIPPLENVTEFPCEDNGLESYTHLWLQNNNLHGKIPPEMYLLTSLKSIALSINHLDGSTISSRIGDLSSLEVIAMAAAGITGTIPTELGSMPNLVDFMFTSNSLQGTIPSELGLLSLSEAILLDFNQLTGTIPPELGSLTSLVLLYLFDNFLTGTIPSRLVQGAASLADFGAEHNELTGGIPTEISTSSALQVVTLHDNQLTGTIPADFNNETASSSASSSLQIVFLFNNLLTGTIPSNLGQAKELWVFHVDVNLLSGTIPRSFPLPMEELFLDKNYLTGQIPSQLGLLPQLATFSARNNQLSGTIPHQLNQSFWLLDVSENNLSGTVPEHLCNLDTEFCPYQTVECDLVFDCNDLLCGCGCPCEEEAMNGTVIEVDTNITA